MPHKPAATTAKTRHAASLDGSTRGASCDNATIPTARDRKSVLAVTIFAIPSQPVTNQSHSARSESDGVPNGSRLKIAFDPFLRALRTRWTATAPATCRHGTLQRASATGRTIAFVDHRPPPCNAGRKACCCRSPPSRRRSDYASSAARAQVSSVTSPDTQPPRSAAITASRFFGPPANAIVGRLGGVSSGTLVTRALVDTSTSRP